MKFGFNGPKLSEAALFGSFGSFGRLKEGLPSCRTPAVALTSTPNFDYTALLGLPEAPIPNADPATGLARQSSVAAQYLLRETGLLHIVAVSQQLATSHTSLPNLHSAGVQKHKPPVGHHLSSNNPEYPPAQNEDKPSKQQSQPSRQHSVHSEVLGGQQEPAAAVAAAALPLEQGPRPIHPQDSLPSYLAAKHAPASKRNMAGRIILEMGPFPCKFA